MVASFFVLGLTKGVERPAIATSLPTLTGEAIMLDVGANVDCNAQHLLQFAIMGNEYGQHLFKKPNPRVGLLSIGEEDSKGNEVTKEAFKLLRSSPLNFIGNVEGRDVYSGNADVAPGVSLDRRSVGEAEAPDRLCRVRRCAIARSQRDHDDLSRTLVREGDQECHSQSEGTG